MDNSAVEVDHFIRRLSYPETNCVLLCYSVISKNSLKNIVNYWYPEIKSQMPNVPSILCGNKLDLKDIETYYYITNQESIEITKKLKNIKGHFQCSAFNDINNQTSYIREVFGAAIKEAAKYICRPTDKIILNCNLF